MIELISSDDYRTLIRETTLERKKNLGQHFSFQSVAKACRVPKTYLSTVLRGNGHLNSEQVFLACDYLGMTEFETDFVLTLYELQRAVVPKRKKFLAERLLKLRNNASLTEKHIHAKKPETNGTANIDHYYLDPLVQIIHIALTCPNYAANIDALALALQLPKERVSQIISQLCRMGLVELTKQGCRVTEENLHLSRESHIYPAHRRLIRMAALEKFDRNASPHDYSFAAVFTANQEGREKIQAEFLKFLKKAQAVSTTTNSAEVYQMTFDFVRWTT